MPVYNGAAWINEALDSLVTQDYQNVEILVADDGSSDASVEICQRFAQRHACIRFTENPANLGAVENFRNTLRQSRGEYFLWASQDDIWMPGFISLLVQRLEACPDCLVALGRVDLIDQGGGYIRSFAFDAASSPEQMSPLRLAYSLLSMRDRRRRKVKNNNYIHGIWRTGTFRKVVDLYPGGFSNERFLLMQLALHGKFAYVEEARFSKRVHLDESRRANDSVVKMKRDGMRVAKDIYKTVRSILADRELGLWTRIRAAALFVPYVLNFLFSRFVARAVPVLRRSLPDVFYKRIRDLYRVFRPSGGHR